MIVGLSGKARAGKDTVGAYLVERYGFERRSFADELRRSALELNPLLHLDSGQWVGNWRLAEIVDRLGWEQAKELPEVRLFLQQFGRVMRSVWEPVWVEAAMKGLDRDVSYVFTDVRFVNEAERIRRLGGEVWRVHRPDAGLVVGGDDSSETELDGFRFDASLRNESTIEAVHADVDTLMRV